MQTHAAIDALVEKLNNAAYYYHSLRVPVLTDAEYDELFQSLKKLERENPQYIHPDSPTRLVAPKNTVSEIKAVKHTVPMLSLGNVFTVDELTEWARGVAEKLRDKPEFKQFEFDLEYKLDGLAFSLTYVDGILVSAVSRGDGEYGEEFTENVKTIRNVPIKLSSPLSIEVRGEIVFPISAFQQYNKDRIAMGEEPYSNPRNAAAGAMRLLDVTETAKRPLGFYAYSLYGGDCKTHKESLEVLDSLGFMTTMNLIVMTVNIESDFSRAIERFTLNRLDESVLIDGVVVKVRDIKAQEFLGMSRRDPNWAIAYKFPATEATTKVYEIEWQIGRSGVITPVAYVTPVEVCGVKISRVTLHNLDEIERLGLHIGDTVTLIRSGDVIPKIINVISGLRPEDAFAVRPPTICMSCGGELSRLEDEAKLYCRDHKNCKEQLVQKLIHFGSREAMNFQGLGLSSAKVLVHRLGFNHLSDLLDIKDLHLERYLQEVRNGRKLLVEIYEKLPRDKFRMIYGLGIPHVGLNTSKLLIERFGDLEGIITASLTDIASIPNLGAKVAANIHAYFQDESYITDARTWWAKLSKMEDKKSSDLLKGKTFHLTGKWTTIPRKIAEDTLLLHGADITSNFIKADMLIVGDGGMPTVRKVEFFESSSRLIYTWSDFIKAFNISQ